MFVRLLLALLIAVFALPGEALASCHGAGPPASHHATAAHHAPVHEHRAVAGDLCLGCIPPENWRAGEAPAPALAPAAPLTARAVRLDLAPAAPPATPPPRLPA